MVREGRVLDLELSPVSAWSCIGRGKEQVDGRLGAPRRSLGVSRRPHSTPSA